MISYGGFSYARMENIIFMVVQVEGLTYMHLREKDILVFHSKIPNSIFSNSVSKILPIMGKRKHLRGTGDTTVKGAASVTLTALMA